MDNSATLPLKLIIQYLKNRDIVYERLNQQFFLPALNSHAVNADYLLKYILIDQKILKIERHQMMNLAIPKTRRHFTVVELVEKLEDFLRSKQLPPTGFSPGCSPDQEWLLKVFLHLDPGDSLQIFDKYVPIEETVVRSVDAA
jgi:hypothetical protein